MGFNCAQLHLNWDTSGVSVQKHSHRHSSIITWKTSSGLASIQGTMWAVLNVICSTKVESFFSFLLKVTLFQWGGIHPQPNMYEKSLILFLHEFAVVVSISASWSGWLPSTLNHDTDDQDWDSSLSRKKPCISTEHHNMSSTPLCHFCLLHLIAHQRTSTQRSKK